MQFCTYLLHFPYACSDLNEIKTNRLLGKCILIMQNFDKNSEPEVVQNNYRKKINLKLSCTRFC